MEIVLVGINPNDINDRPVFDTGLSTVGRGGDDYFCAHCGHKMMTSFNMARLELDIVFKCGACGGHNISPDLEGRTAETAIKDEIPLHDAEAGEGEGTA
jgi:hypothetical protein